MNAPTATVKVLVAEDNEDHLFLIVRALRSTEGTMLEVDSVRDGAETLDYLYGRGRFAGAGRPSLIILDLKMPKVDGLEVLEQVKGDAGLREIPVIVLSSSDRPEDISNAYRSGGNCYVTKPATVAGMRAGLESISRFWTRVASLPHPTT
jgi:CheY-like chemotaxis protein